MKKLYVICNSHLDPVWLWNLSCGRSAWINTVHSVVRMMDEIPELKFTCSTAAQYRWIEETDPGLFRKIAALVEQGRWEITGGWEVQSDAVIARPETLVRQALHGKEYFRRKFGVEVTTAYCVDSFGHGADLPKILKETGFTHYVCLRMHDLPPLFTWKADDGSGVTVLRINTSYGTGGVTRAWLDDFLQEHVKSPLERQAMFFGVGDHGGGLSRIQLRWLQEAREKYDIVFSTLQEYFRDVADLPLPTVTGELGPVFRGCYTSCHEVKRKVARATRRLIAAEKLGVPAAELDSAWKDLLFFHFHDSLPGTSTRPVYERDVFPGLGGVESTADRLIDRELHRRGAALDTRFMEQGGMLCRNPHPEEHNAILAHTGFADPNGTGRYFNALRDESGKEYPLQILPPPSTFGPAGMAWGVLTSVVKMPAWSSRSFAYAYTEKEYPALGFAAQRTLLDKLSFEVYFDDTHSWGFGLEKFSSLSGRAERIRTEEYVNGPVCSILRSEWKYGASGITLDLIRYAGIPETGVRIRLDWHEIKCALKLVCRHGLRKPEFLTGSGITANRRLTGESYDEVISCDWRQGKLCSRYPGSGEYSMIDWCAACSESASFAVYAPDIHSCDHADNMLRVTLARPILYADHAPFPPDDYYGWTEQGVSERRLWLAELGPVSPEELPGMAAARLVNAESCEITAHEPGGDLYPVRDLPSVQIRPALLEAYRFNENGDCEIHVRNPRGEAVEITLPEPAGKQTIPPRSLRIITWRPKDAAKSKVHAS